MSDSVRPHRQQPTRLCRPWDSPGKNTGVGCHCLLQHIGSNSLTRDQTQTTCTGSTKSQPLDHQGSPYHLLLKTLLRRSVQQLNPFPVFIIYYIFSVLEFLSILCKIIFIQNIFVYKFFKCFKIILFGNSISFNFCNLFLLSFLLMSSLFVYWASLIAR